MAEELTPNAFIGCSAPPADEQLTAALGSSRKLWDEVLAGLRDEFHLSDWEWNSYSPKAGWNIRVKKGKRNILYLAPCKGSFRVAFVLGGKAVQAARDGKSPAAVMKLIDAGTKYPEGLGIRLQVKSRKDAAPIRELARLKLEH